MATVSFLYVSYRYVLNKWRKKKNNVKGERWLYCHVNPFHANATIKWSVCILYWTCHYWEPWRDCHSGSMNSIITRHTANAYMSHEKHVYDFYFHLARENKKYFRIPYGTSLANTNNSEISGGENYFLKCESEGNTIDLLTSSFLFRQNCVAFRSFGPKDRRYFPVEKLTRVNYFRI